MKIFILLYLIGKLFEVEIANIFPQKEGGFLLVLKKIDSEEYLPISIGDNEGLSILRKLQEVPFPRPMTYELINKIIKELGGEVEKITIDKLKDGIFYATIHLNQGKKKILIDSRPSDAINIAIRNKVKIFVEENVFKEMKIDIKKEKKKEGLKI
ncbi:MAG: bifunctional nuclease family protein [candidate division WOR-3 bacterium]